MTTKKRRHWTCNDDPAPTRHLLTRAHVLPYHATCTTCCHYHTWCKKKNKNKESFVLLPRDHVGIIKQWFTSHGKAPVTKTPVCELALRPIIYSRSYMIHSDHNKLFISNDYDDSHLVFGVCAFVLSRLAELAVSDLSGSTCRSLWYNLNLQCPQQS
jgi:hypothetical protein